MRVTELDTPSLLVDLPRLTANLERMAGYARAAGLKLRPHTKTHKTPQIAKLQLTHGAAGLTVAKLGEAEVMADAGITDIFIANEIVGPQKIARLLELSRRAKVSVGVDSPEVADPLSQAFVAEGRRLPVLIEVDLGLGRCGLKPDAAAPLAEHMNTLGGLELVGVFSYAGQVYAARDEDEVAEVAAQEARSLGKIGENLRALTQSELRISGGSTPTARHYHPACGLTEIRPGTYVFNDRMQLTRWSAQPADCALTVLATVISTPEPGRAVLDAGSKALGTDQGAGLVGYGVLKEDLNAVVARVNEEHGVLDLTQASLTLRVGDKVEVIPNHCCVTVNLHDEMHIVRDGDVVETWPIAARGKMR